MAAQTWAILLAAGESRRMGRPKPLLPWGGTSLLAWQVGQLREAGCDRVVAVLGHAAEAVQPEADAVGAGVVLNASYREGRASSLRMGAAAVADDAESVVILGVDQPRPAWVTARLLTERRTAGAPLAIPRHGGHGGHPLIAGGALLPEIRAAEEATFGLRAITRDHQRETVFVNFESRCVIVDLNTPEEYEDALAAFNRGEWRR